MSSINRLFLVNEMLGVFCDVGNKLLRYVFVE